MTLVRFEHHCAYCGHYCDCPADFQNCTGCANCEEVDDDDRDEQYDDIIDDLEDYL